jgi:hypothetical protein
LLFDLYLLPLPLLIWGCSAGTARPFGRSRLAGAPRCRSVHRVDQQQALVYAILFAPALDLVLAAFLLQFPWRPPRPSPAWGFGMVLTISLLLGGIGRTLLMLQVDQYAQYQTVQARLNALVRPGESLIGAQTYWLGLPERRYVSWEELVYYRRVTPGSSFADALRALRPDVFVLDGHVDYFVSDDAAGGTRYWRALRLPRAEVEAALRDLADPAGEFDGGPYGVMRVYRLHWSAELHR